MSEDLTEKLTKNGNDREILTAIKELDVHVTKIDDRLQSLESKVDGIENKVDGIENKVDGLEKKVDQRLHDTRPIWHKVVADIAELQSGQKRLEEGQKRLEEGQEDLRLGMSQIHGSVRDVSRDQIIINDVVRRLQMDVHNIDEKLFKLTIKRDQQNSET